MPKLSVIMSVYNGSAHLTQAIESILNQNFKDFEFLIFNDGSTDNSQIILNELVGKDARIQVFNQANCGLTKTLNKGLQLAKGEYVARMDADDISAPGRFEQQVKFLDDHADIGLVGSFVKIINDAGKPVGEHCPPTEHDKIRKLSFFSGQITHSSVMFRRKAVASVGNYDESFIYAQDADLWFRLMKEYKVAIIPNFLVTWRKSATGISVAKAKKQKYFAQLAKRRAIKAGLYPFYFTIFLLWPYLRSFVPENIKSFFKRKV